jgi:hypothetical protein
MRRNKQLLLVLGVVLVLAIVYAYQATPVQKHAEKIAPKQSASARFIAGEKDASATAQKLQLERLQRNSAVSATVKRDIFNFYIKPVVVKSPPPPKPVMPPLVVPPMPVIKPQPQVILPSLKYLGQLEKEDQQFFFLAQDEEVFVVRIRQSFGKQNQFAIKSFDGEKLLIKQGPNLPDLRLQVADPGNGPPRPVETQADPGQPFVEQSDSFGFPDGRPRLKSFKLRSPYGNRH